MIRILTLVTCLVAISSGSAVAFTINEATDGDLSGIDSFPSNLVLEVGDNSLIGSAGSSVDFDIFHINVPAPLAITGLFLNGYSPSAGVSFLGIQHGTTWTAGKGSGVDGNSLIGWTLFGINNVGQDLLPGANTTNNGASGFDIPLGVGDYVFLIQDTGDAINYDLTFVATPVPLPPSLLLVASGFVSVLRLVRKQR